MKPKLYFIQWQDHWTQSTEWFEKYPEFSVPTVSTVGWLVDETKEVYVVTPNIDLSVDPPAWKGVTGILKSAVVKKKLIKL